jgi:hypothetical protein
VALSLSCYYCRREEILGLVLSVVLPIRILFFISVIVIIIMRKVTMCISEEVSKELLRIAGILQSGAQRKIVYKDVIRYLIRKSKDERPLRPA